MGPLFVDRVFVELFEVSRCWVEAVCNFWECGSVFCCLVCFVVRRFANVARNPQENNGFLGGGKRVKEEEDTLRKRIWRVRILNGT